MKKLISLLTAVLVCLSLPAAAVEVTKTQIGMDKGDGKPGMVTSRLTMVTATVEAIDYDKRIVQLRGKDGNLTTLKVDERAKNFKNAKVGDQVQAEYYNSVALFVQKADETQPPAAEFSAVELAPLGEKPGVSAVDTETIKATVESIDYETRVVTLKGPEGKLSTLTVDESALGLKKVKVGDEVVARYTQAIAISVRTPQE